MESSPFSLKKTINRVRLIITDDAPNYATYLLRIDRGIQYWEGRKNYYIKAENMYHAFCFLKYLTVIEREFKGDEYK